MRVPSEFSRLDRLDIHVAYGVYPNAAPEDVFLLQLHVPRLHGRPWQDDDVVAELVEPLTWSRTEPGRDERIPYNLSVRKGHFSWGADGASANVLLYIANHLMSGGLSAAGGAAALAALKRVRDKLRPDNDSDRFLDTREELEEYGRWSIQAAYRDWLPAEEELSLVGESQSDGEWMGTYTDGSGNEYAVTLRPSEGHPNRVRISRRGHESSSSGP